MLSDNETAEGKLDGKLGEKKTTKKKTKRVGGADEEK